MDCSNKDAGLDDVNAGDSENKSEFGDVHGGGGGDNNDGGRVDDVGGVDFNGGDVYCGDGERKL